MTIEVWKLSFTAEVAIGEGWTTKDTEQLHKEFVRLVKQQGYLNDLMIGQSEFSIQPDKKAIRIPGLRFGKSEEEESK